MLDHGGPDLAFVLYGSAIKLFLFAGLLVHMVLPVPPAGGALGAAVFVAGAAAVAVLVGIVESVTARIRLLRVPQLLVGASVVAALGLAVVLYRGNP